VASLRILRLCDNEIEQVDLAPLPNLRTVFVDNNKVGSLQNTDLLRKLENLSVRDQSGTSLCVYPIARTPVLSHPFTRNERAGLSQVSTCATSDDYI
jgi:Leucine-rich repeat (LRR) protein